MRARPGDNGARKPVEGKVVEISLFTTGFSIHPKGGCLGFLNHQLYLLLVKESSNYHKLQCKSMGTLIDSSIISIDFLFGLTNFSMMLSDFYGLHV